MKRLLLVFIAIAALATVPQTINAQRGLYATYGDTHKNNIKISNTHHSIYIDGLYRGLQINGKKVDGIKDHLSWAMDKESVMNGWNGDYIDMNTPDGDTYSDYLDLMTYMTGEDTKLLRIMDLIQLNLRYYYRSDFLISEHYTGLDYTLLVNGKSYSFSDSYGGR